MPLDAAPDSNEDHSPLLVITALLYLLIGLALVVGGASLLRLGGSPYYLLAGIGLAIIAVLLFARRRAALSLMAVFLVLSLAWSLWEVQLDWWQLVPRLDLWFVLGVWLLLPLVNLRVRPDRLWKDRPSVQLCLALALVALTGIATAFTHPHRLDGHTATSPAPAAVTRADWVAYGGTSHGDRYSPAAQITPQNVHSLQRAWTYHTHDLLGPSDPKELANEVTPLAADGKLFICTPHNYVVALDPDTGKELWSYDSRISRRDKTYQHMICRGVAYYGPEAYGMTGKPADVSQACYRRVFTPTADATIVALDAETGKLCQGFGKHGVIDLKEGEGHVIPGYLNPTSPPLVTQHVLIAGASVTDNASTDEPSGVVRGYDIETGKLLWNWDPARPDETTPLPPGGEYVRNSPNMWSVAAADEKLGLVYLPTGNQTPDIWGGNRIRTAERFNSAVVALDIATGRLRWVYQTVHHDLWDMDICGQPSLLDLQTPHGRVPALVASTKRGDIYILDRRDGRLLVPAPEEPVPQGAAAGDQASLTQPFSELSFKPAPLREKDMWGISPFDQLICRILYKQYRYQGIFTPPSEQGSLVYPGNYGVFDWGGIAVDPVRQLLVLNPNYMVFVSQLYPHGSVTPTQGSELGLQPMAGTPFAVDLHPLLSPLHVPCQAPPWGYMAVVDLKTMRTVWMHKNGTVRDITPLPFPFKLGVPSLGGPMVTAGGVAFMGAALDYYLRAYDVATGAELWKARLPAGGQATPMSFISRKTGRQYVVIMAGGHNSLGTKMGDSLNAYALPEAQP